MAAGTGNTAGARATAAAMAEAGAIVELLAGETGRADPYPLYARARELGPVAPLSDSFVLVTGYAEVNRLLREPGFGVVDGTVLEAWWATGPGERDASQEPDSMTLLGRSILQANPPRHARMRAPIASVFTPRRVAALEPAVSAVLDALLDELAELGADGTPVDFMEQVAYRLPVGVICELLGVPEQDRHRFRPLGHELTRALEFASGQGDLSGADEAARELSGYFTRLAAERRAEPRDDLVSALVGLTEGDGARLTDAELIGNLVLLLVAGFETTTNLLGNGLTAVFAHPKVHAALRAGALPAADLVEEVLRYDSPVQLTSRVALREGLDAGGVPLPKYGEALLLIGAANRDPARFPEPDRFDPWRADVQPLSFGAGAHYCLGAMLARLEATLAFRALFARFPGLAPAPGQEPVRNDRLLLRGYATLPVVLG
ncbi:cytochrome P450 [Streptacidiphilus cavernicola]|uniref:Cytochrome P450 n=1 Tax=Streptacidiphilus cavernicola TaxID=3342716 RepID=A0ABV6VSC0_9ACTN